MSEHRRRTSYRPWIVLLVHSSAVVTMGLFIGSAYSTTSPTGGEATMAWTVFLAIDFPLGWLIIPAFEIGPGIRTLYGPFAADVIAPAVGFFILGGIQYFWLTKFVIWWRQRASKRKESKGSAFPVLMTKQDQSDEESACE